MQNECDMLLASFNREVNDFAKRVGKDRASASYRTLVTVNKHLHAFVGRFYQSKDVPMQDLTGTFFRDFCLYLQFDCRLAPATVWAYTAPLKRIVAHAHQDGLISKNPFARCHVTPIVKERQFLTEKELMKVMQQPFEQQALRDVRNLFVFACWTGMAFVDLQHLDREQLFEMDDSWWIIGHRQKTKTLFQIKLLDVPLAILKEYASFQNALPSSLLPMYGYKRTSRLLRKIMAACGIQKPITFHCARHTFATLALSKGMPIESVSRILGHTKIATTQIYARITLNKLSKDFEVFTKQT